MTSPSSTGRLRQVWKLAIAATLTLLVPAVVQAAASRAAGSRGWLGVTLDTRSAALSGGQSGVRIISVESGSPADEAGLRAGDIVIRVEGAETPDAGALAGEIRARQPGDTVRVVLVRGGEERSVRVALGEPPGATGDHPDSERVEKEIWIGEEDERGRDESATEDEAEHDEDEAEGEGEEEGEADAEELLDIERQVEAAGEALSGALSGIEWHRLVEGPDGVAQVLNLPLPSVWMGVQSQELGPELRRHFGAPEDRGVLVGHIRSESPADRAGLRVGDVIVEADGRPVEDPGDLMAALRKKKTGDSVELRIVRDRRESTLSVRLARRPEPRMLGKGAGGGRLGPAERRVIIRKLGEEWREQQEQLQQRVEELQKQVDALQGRMKELAAELAERAGRSGGTRR